MPPAAGPRFGPYRLDLHGHRLFRGDQPVPLQLRQFRLLRCLVEHAGEVLTRYQLIERVWKGKSVADNNLTQVVFHLRSILDPDDPARYIETVPRVGYRFVADVSRERSRHTDAQLDALLASQWSLVDGRAALETLEAAAMAPARHTFEAIAASPPPDVCQLRGRASACRATYPDPLPWPAARALAGRDGVCRSRRARPGRARDRRRAHHDQRQGAGPQPLLPGCALLAQRAAASGRRRRGRGPWGARVRAEVRGAGTSLFARVLRQRLVRPSACVTACATTVPPRARPSSNRSHA